MPNGVRDTWNVVATEFLGSEVEDWLGARPGPGWLPEDREGEGSGRDIVKGDARGGPRVSGAAVKLCRGARNQAASTLVEVFMKLNSSTNARAAAWPLPRPELERFKRVRTRCARAAPDVRLAA